MSDSDIDIVLVLTRHGSHSRLVAEALGAGKHVFVEKPVALDMVQLRDVAEAYGRSKSEAEATNGGKSSLLMVGFNRRYSPLAAWLKERIEGIDEPLAVNCVVNAGWVPADSWVNDPTQGGGRIIGEVCHFIDLISFLTSSLPSRVYVERIGNTVDKSNDSIVATITLNSGSIATISYLAKGDKRYPRERIEVSGGGAVGVIDNFKSASFYRNGRVERRKNRMSVDRGHEQELKTLLSATAGSVGPPVEFGDYVSTTLTTFAMVRSLTTLSPEAPDYEGLARAGIV